EVEATEPAQRQNPTTQQERGGLLEGVPVPCPRGGGRRLVPDPRAADGAAVGLGMKAAVAGRAVLPRAPGTLGKPPHAGALPIVGERVDHREARTAVGAGDEGIAVPAIGRVEELRLTGRADRGIGGNRLPAVGLVRAPKDGEAIDAGGKSRLWVHSVDAGGWGRLV